MLAAMGRVLAGAVVAAAVGVVSIAVAGSGTSVARTKVTVWAAPSHVTATSYGGLGYGGYAPTSGAMITEQRVIDLPGDVDSGDIRVAGVAATVDPASVQLRDLTEPTAAITAQRFVPAATSPTEILQRSVGSPVTVVTTKGEVSGVLRSADESTLVVEVGTGDRRSLQVLRRDGYVQDVKLPASEGIDRPSLVWRVAAKKPGKHTIELSYRADGMSWAADYLAVLDDTNTALDFSAWATIRNTTGATFDGVELTLVSGGNTGPSTYNPYGGAGFRGAAPAPPVRYTVPAPVHLAAGQAVQVELMPTKKAAKAKPIVLFEAMPDPSLGFQAYPNTDCNQFNGVGMGNGRAEIAVEIDVPTKEPLPEGRVRAFRRKGERLEIVSEDQLRSSAGVARIRLSADAEISGERKAVACTYDERTRTITEKVEIRVENKSKRASEVVVREFAWRWPMWKLDSEDAKSARGGPQTLEYRASIPAGGKRTITYAVVYSW